MNLERCAMRHHKTFGLMLDLDLPKASFDSIFL